MKIYMSENDMPKNKDFKCKGCEFIEHISATQKVCKPTGTHGHGNNGDCPLQSLEQHDNEVRREFAEMLKSEMKGLTTVINEIDKIAASFGGGEQQ